MLVRSQAIIAGFLLLVLACFCSCDEDKPIAPETGYISVYVYDNSSESPIPIQNAEITVVPGDLVQLTGVNGRTVFEVDPGEYYVDAEICCFIIFPVVYHIPVTVTKGDTVEVDGVELTILQMDHNRVDRLDVSTR